MKEFCFERSANLFIQKAIIPQLLDKISNSVPCDLYLVRQRTGPALHANKCAGTLTQFEKSFMLKF
jgi:hypothetical protein